MGYATEFSGALKTPAKKTGAKKRWHFGVSPDIEIGGRPLVFPDDMLRYDKAEFVEKKDKDRARAKKPNVHLVSDQEPTHDRWASFGWKVIFTERE